MSMFRLTKCRTWIRLFLLISLISSFEITSSQDRYNFVYTDRNSFISAGWDFIAVEPGGYSRNTETTSGAVVSFDQAAHPGVIRVPVDVGDLYTGSNNTRNTIFRDLPTGWTSVRLRIASFSPQQNYQQAGLAIYQDDNNYIQITRNYNGANIMTFLHETNGVAVSLNTQPRPETSNIHFRLNRDPSTESITAYYSLNGTNWNYVGVVVHGLNDPRLAIVTGASPGGFPPADFSWVEVDYQSTSSDILQAHPGAIVFNGIQGQSLNGTRSIFISTVNGGKISWNQSISGSWLNGDHQSGETDGVLKVNVNTSGLQPGTYNGAVVLDSPQSTGDPVVVPVTLIINPNVPVKITTWKDGYAGAMSVSTDDGKYSGYDLLQANGLKGTFVSNNSFAPSQYAAMYNAGMELGSHLVTHPCYTISESVLRYQEIEPNISGLVRDAGIPGSQIITLVWPCGFTNYREQVVAADYFLSARSYNTNMLEDAIPENFMNLKSYNSEEHFPYPPSDYKTLVDQAVSQKKWFNLVLHDYSNDDGAINYAPSRDIWVAPIGTVVKYIMQRERFILTNYNSSGSKITFNVSRLSIPSSDWRSFENAFGSADVSTLEIDIDDSRTVNQVLINGSVNPYQVKNLNGNLVLITNVRLESANVKSVEIKYVYTGPTIGLTITGVTGNSRVYNGNVNATLNTSGAALVGVEAGDVVTLNSTGATGTFINKNVGSAKTISTAGFILGGADADKYSLSYPVTSANITASNLTVTGITANNKEYDGTTTATLNTGSATLVGVFGADQVSINLTGITGTFVNSFVGTNKSVTITGVSLQGDDAFNYTLSQPTTTANITGIGITVTGITANNKVYNGTTTATLNTGNADLSGVRSGDAVTLVTSGAYGNFNNKNVGSGKTVTVSGLTLSGADAPNYSILPTITTASITTRNLTISGTIVNSKVYNGTTLATLNTSNSHLSGVLSGDNVTLVSASAVGTFANKDTGTSIPVEISGFTVNGIDAGNYALIQPPPSTANISRATLTISGLNALDKEYDGTVNVELNTTNATLSGVYGTDIVELQTANASATFSNKNAGTEKLVTTSGFSIEGIDAGNYILNQPVITASIIPVSLTIEGVTGTNKIYDGNTNASINTINCNLEGVIGNDAVYLNSTGATGTFSDKNAGIAKNVSTSGFTISGHDSRNYVLIQPVSIANILKADLTLTGLKVNDKVYDGTTNATLNYTTIGLAGIIGSDEVFPVTSGGTGTFINKNAGSGKEVTIESIGLAGADAGNYNIILPTITGNIQQRDLTITAKDISKPYSTELIFTGTEFRAQGLVSGDIIPPLLISSPGQGASVLVGTYPIYVSGGTDPNYIFHYVNGILTVNRAVLTASAENKTKSYGSDNPDLSITYSGFINNDDISMIDVLPVVSTNALTTSNAGNYVITISGGSDNCYDFNLIDGVLEIKKAPLVVAAKDKTKIYLEENPELEIEYSGFAGNENQNHLDKIPLTETEAASDSNAGEYPIDVFGGADNNYYFTYKKGTLRIEKADQIIDFEEIPDGLRMSQQQSLNASSSSGLPVSFVVADPTKGTLNGNILTIRQDGLLTIIARQEGNINYNAAPIVTQSIVTLPTFDNINSLFTPNSDGMNDYWYIPDIDQYGRIQVIVYNRFGKTVYESDSYNNDWDGTWNNDPLPAASYYYIIKSSELGLIKGVVNLVR